MKKLPIGKSSFKLQLLFLILFSSAVEGYCQNLLFRPYGADKGLIDNYVYNINQDDNGYLWLGTGNGICRFDGFNFSGAFPGDVLSATIVDKSFKDSKGRIWFGFRDGSVAVYENFSFRKISPDTKYTGIIAGFAETGTGEILIATQTKGIIIAGDDYSLTYLNTGLEGQNLSSICVRDDDVFLIGTFNGLFQYRYFNDRPAFELTGKVKGIPSAKVLTIEPRPGTMDFWIGTEDEGLYLLNIAKNDSALCEVSGIGVQLGLKYSKVQKVMEDNEKNLWVATNGEGVFMLYSPGSNSDTYTSVKRYTDQNGMPSNYISDIFMDFEGNIWFASTGHGITVLRDQAFTFFNFERPGFNDNILSLANEDEVYYLGGESGILVTDISGQKPDYFLDLKNGIPNDRITVLFKDSNKFLWIGTSASGIYRLKIGEKTASRVFYSQNSLENSVNAIKESREYIWVATKGGVFRFNKSTMEKTHFTTSERLPHNYIRDILIDSKDQAWIATRANGLFNVSEARELNIDVRTEFEFVSLAEDKDGMLWAATAGYGVLAFGHDSILHISDQTGLKSNYCYSIACDAMGNIWVGHRLGMSKIEVKTRKVISYSTDQGITVDCNYNAVITNAKGNLVFGTSKGMIEYDPLKDKEDISPPKVNITSLKISDQDYDFREKIVLPYNLYRVRIEFIGINLKNPEGVKYQYKLMGYDEIWSEPSPLTFANFHLEDGEYTFIVRACDPTGLCSENSFVNIKIKIPVWKTWWFILVSILSLVAAVLVIIKVRERRHRQLQEFLQKSLDERTREVIEQAREIENKNRDITDSINYAQRIQASILPPIKRLQDTFPGSFIFYQPRDIVSGDFYWYDSVWDDKFVVVCADSTGHGVPGAFMSMIGATLIKDICARPGVNSPSALLKTLDIEIMSSLNQNVEAERSNDGMDVTVIEIDLKKKYLRLASAMRPIILYLKDEQVYVKGSRHSIGGRFDQDSESKVFNEEEFQLSSGDLIYMFSDGYPDQFGGPLEKKFKMVRLKNLLHDIHDKPMEEQYNYIRNNFNLWKEDLNQVDDVLFMGIKI